jgi:aminoglycoside phosphotransferase (APT) family kinase protein
MQIHDPKFPGLPHALDPDAIVDALRAALPECAEDITVEDGTVVDVRYRPGGPCWVLYRLKLRRDGGRSRRQLVSGEVLPAGARPSQPPRELLARYAAHEGALLRTPVVHLPRIPMALHAYPVDASLPGLFDAAEPDAMRRHLDRLWERRGVRVRQVVTTPLGYTPHARAAFRYEVLSEARSSGVPELRRLIGKMHAKKPAERLFADQWAVWRAARGRVRMAPPVGYLGGVGLTLQEQVRGERLGGLVDAPEFGRWVRLTARALASLHELEVPLRTRRRPDEEAASVQRWAGVLLTIRPDLAARVGRLRDRLSAAVEARTTLSSPIHADFHHTNVLVDGERVTVIDFDEMAFGDPMVDVGRFLASLRVPGRRAFGSVRALNDTGDVFLQEYLRRRGGDEKRARLFEAAALLIAAGSSFRIQRATWVEEVSELVEEAERVFALASPAARVVKPTTDRPRLTLEERARWAADGVFMQASLAPHVEERYGAELTDCDVTPQDTAGPGRRFVYDLRGWRGTRRWRVKLEGAVRQRGGLRRFSERLELLRAAIAGTPAGLTLPRPVGHVPTIGVLVWEPPAGTRLSAVIGTPRGTSAARRFGQGLAALHEVRAALECSPWTIEQEVDGVRARLDRTVRDGLRRRAGDVLDTVEREGRALPAKFAPALRTLPPQHVLCDDGRIGLRRVDDVGLAHPSLDAADFLARVTLLALTVPAEARAWTAVGGSFREAYEASVGWRPIGLCTLEAGALVRLACREAGRGRADGVAEWLIAAAERTLAA